MKCDPEDEEPAGPVLAFKHEYTRNDHEDAGEMNVPVAHQIAKRQHTAEKRYAAENNEEPTDDRNRSRAHRLDSFSSLSFPVE